MGLSEISPRCFLRVVPTRGCTLMKSEPAQVQARLPEGTPSSWMQRSAFLQAAVARPDSSGAPVSTGNRAEVDPSGAQPRNGRDTALGCLRSQKEKPHSSSATKSFQALPMAISLTTLMLSMTTFWRSELWADRVRVSATNCIHRDRPWRPPTGVTHSGSQQSRSHQNSTVVKLDPNIFQELSSPHLSHPTPQPSRSHSPRSAPPHPDTSRTSWSHRRGKSLR